MRVSGIIVAVLAASVAVGAAQRLTKQEADQFNAKLVRIVSLGKAKPLAGAPQRVTQISDNELNAYFRHNAKDQIPAGILEPTINAVGNGQLTGSAIVDLDVVRKQKQRGWLDPMGYLTGRLPVTAQGTLTTKDGIGKFVLSSAEVSGISVPKSLLQELLSYYSKSADHPGGINMDDPFELPANIREIRVGQAQATIVQ